MKVLTFGATGVQGGPVARRLLEAGHQVRALVRDPQKAADLSAAGVEIVAGDQGDRESVMAAARGVDAVFFHPPLVFDRETGLTYARNIIDAAAAASVKILVLNTSGFVPGEDTGLMHFDLKRTIETYCEESGVPTIILRPVGPYMEILHETEIHSSMIENGTLAYPVPTGHTVSWITVEDVAAISVAAIERPDLAGTTLDVGGPDPLTGEELAEQLSAALGHPITYLALPAKTFAEGLATLLGEEVAGIVAESFFFIEDADTDCLAIAEAEAVAADFDVELTPVHRWAAIREWMASANHPA